MMRRGFWAAGVLGLITCGAVACAPVEDAEGDKGAEEGELGLEGKSDSFRSPTEHGILTPGVPSTVRVTEDQVFHAWTFSIEGDATISLRTQQLADNLDTVMYLYRRDEGETSWGRYIAKNDDRQKNLWSQIDEDVTEAGEYRVIVKPFKSAMRGNFTMEFSCDGLGCAPEPQAFECKESDIAGRSGVNDTCAHNALAILSSPIVPVPTGSDAMKCISDRASDHYVSWMGELVGEVEEGDLNVSTTRLGDAGARVTIDMGGDEDEFTYLFDADGQMLVWFHSEQSPYWEWSCGEGTGDTSQVLDDDDNCTYHLLQSLPAGPNVRTVGATLSDGTEEPAVALAIETAIDELSLTGDEEWSAEITDSGTARVEIVGYTYTVVEDWTGWTLIARTVRGESTFYCKVSDD